ncbi:MAG: phosphoadenylyl-sulfate reductase [Spirochaetia bacterium]|nr:phosphoadenylyl-sulfate reductase [Spirochaetia bacterium]
MDNVETNYKNNHSLLEDITKKYATTFTTSFGKEDQAITDLIVKNKWPVKIVTIDTGRLFNETYSLHRRTNDQYKIKIESVFPDTNELEKLIRKKGPDSFYDSVENRKECCEIRKVHPLKKTLGGFTVWITGIRKAQSTERSNLDMIEFDEAHQVVKIHPLLNWSDDDLEKYIEENKVPVSILHSKGYPSIGCAPCTRATLPGEDPRAGRWSWENGAKECGLHTH